MRIFKTLKKYIQKADLFGTSTFFRYKSQQTFQSLFGGIVSILIMVIIGAIFYNRFSECLNKTKIYSSETRIIQARPPRFEVTTYPNGKSMAAIEISDLTPEEMNLKLFQYSVQWISEVDGTMKRRLLEPCTLQHWSAIPEILDQIKTMDISKMYCLPLNTTFLIEGKATFNHKYVILSPRKPLNCSSPAGTLPRCPTAAQITKFFQNGRRHKFQVYFINYQITPNKPDHIQPFIDDHYFGYFTDKVGQYFALYVQDFTVNTDEGIGFVPEPVVDQGGLAEEQPVTYQYAVGIRYSIFVFAKSLTSRVYERNFEKVQDVFSFVGCLYGIMCAALFIVKSFNNTAYSIALGAELFESNKIKQKGFFKKYRFLNFIEQGLHKIIKKLKVILNWYETMQFQNCQKEGAKYFDVLHLIQKLTFLENSISILLQNHHEVGLHLRQKLSLEQASNQREIQNFKKRVQKIRKSKLEKRLSLISNNQDSILNKSDIEDKNASLESLTRKGLDKKMAKKYQNESVLIEMEDKISQNAQDLSQESDIEKENDNKNRKSITHEDVLQDLAKIELEAKQNKGISKKIMKRASLNISINEDQAYGNRNSVKEYIKPIIIGENSNQISITAQQIKLVDKRLTIVEEPEQKIKQKNQNVTKKTKLLRILQNFIKNIDIFSASNFIQYRSGSEHKTLLGGIVSILVAGITLFLFYQKMADCINKTTIYSASTKKFTNDPQFLKIQTAPNGEFMASLQIQGMDLTNPQARYFDFFFENTISRLNVSTGKWIDQVVSYPLQRCTLQHWGKTPEIVEAATKFNYSQLLCLPKGISVSVQGISRSNEFRYLEFKVKKCDNSLDLSRPCDFNATNSFLKAPLHNLWFQLTSVVINPQSSKYMQYFLEQRTQLVFSQNMLIQASAYLDDYTVTTDESIFPWVNELVETGSMITQIPKVITRQNINNTGGYLSIKIFKSVNSILYYRSFDKVENVLSFIRGIFGILFSGLFIINSYNITIYQVSLASKLFKSSEASKNLIKNFNFFNFIQKLFYSIIVSLGFSPQWQSLKEYKQYHEQMIKQLDVPSFFKRVDFLESSVETIFEQFEILGLRLKQKPTVDEVKEKRSKFKLKKKLYKMINKIKKHQENQEIKQAKLSKNPNSTSSPWNNMRETQADQSFVKRMENSIHNANQTQSQTVSDINPDLANYLKKFKLENLYEELSSDSQNQEETISAEEEYRIITGIMNLQKQASNGDRISQKILRLANQQVASLAASLTQNFEISDKFNQENPYKKKSDQAKVEVTDLHGIDSSENDRSINQFEKTPKKSLYFS